MKYTESVPGVSLELGRRNRFVRSAAAATLGVVMGILPTTARASYPIVVMCDRSTKEVITVESSPDTAGMAQEGKLTANLQDCIPSLDNSSGA